MAVIPIAQRRKLRMARLTAERAEAYRRDAADRRPACTRAPAPRRGAREDLDDITEAIVDNGIALGGDPVSAHDWLASYLDADRELRRRLVAELLREEIDAALGRVRARAAEGTDRS